MTDQPHRDQRPWSDDAAPSHPTSPTQVRPVLSPGGVEAWHVASDIVPLIALAFTFEGGAAQDPAGKAGRRPDAGAPPRRGRRPLLLRRLPGAARGARHRAQLQRRPRRRSAARSRPSSGTPTRPSSCCASPSPSRASTTTPSSACAPRPSPACATSRTIPASWPRGASSPRRFPSHPYGRPTSGTIESVEAITRDDLVALHRADRRARAA